MLGNTYTIVHVNLSWGIDYTAHDIDQQNSTEYMILEVYE